MAKILLADDDETFRRAAGREMRGKGHAVVSVSDGRQAMERLHQAAFDIFITDLILPEREGIETIAQARREFPDLPIVAVSGSAHDYLWVARKLGATETIRKPVPTGGLHDAVVKVLARSDTKVDPPR